MDAVRREKMFSLKKTRAGHLGYLKKLYKDVEILMRNAENHHEACDKKKDVEIAFTRYFQAYDEHYQFVDDPAMKSEALNACFSVMSGKKEFDERFAEWSQTVQRITSESSVVPREEDGANVEAQYVTRSLAESSSVKSKSSKSSSKGSKSSSRASERSRKAKAELLRRDVELRSNLLKRQEVEREMEQQIAGMKAQEEELRRRIALLTAEGEIEKAKVVDEFYEASEC